MIYRYVCVCAHMHAHVQVNSVHVEVKGDFQESPLAFYLVTQFLWFLFAPC